MSFLCKTSDVDRFSSNSTDKPSTPSTFLNIYNPSGYSSAPSPAQPPSDVFGLSLGNLPDAVLGPATGGRAPPNAPPRRDEVGVATGVREGVSGAAGTLVALESRWLFLLLLHFHLHLVLLPVFLDLGDDGKQVSFVPPRMGLVLLKKMFNFIFKFSMSGFAYTIIWDF